jgi:hypothetical protein
MPEELVILSIIAISCSTYLMARLLKVWQSHIASRTSTPTVSGDSLTSGELESLLTRVCEEANAPILARLNALERRLPSATPRLPPAQTTLLIEPETPQDLVGVTAAQRQRPSVT